MPKKIDNRWVCNICGSDYPREMDALSCEQSHDIILIKIKRSDLMMLIQYLYTGDQDILSKYPGITQTLLKYRKQMSGGPKR